MRRMASRSRADTALRRRSIGSGPADRLRPPRPTAPASWSTSASYSIAGALGAAEVVGDVGVVDLLGQLGEALLVGGDGAAVEGVAAAAGRERARHTLQLGDVDLDAGPGEEHGQVGQALAVPQDDVDAAVGDVPDLAVAAQLVGQFRVGAGGAARVRDRPAVRTRWRRPRAA